MNPYANPSVADFKAYYDRDFPYGTSNDTIKDSDVSKAQTQASVFVQPAFFQTQGAYTIGFNQLTAHYLVMNIRASAQGIAGQWPWLQVGKNAGSVSEAYQIPEDIANNPLLAFLTKTYYGTEYLMSIYAMLTAPCFSVCGRTHP